MSEFAEKVNKWYAAGLWNKAMCKLAVVKGKITKEEYKGITGVTYKAA